MYVRSITTWRIHLIASSDLFLDFFFYLHQCIFSELWRVKGQIAVCSSVHSFSLTVSTASSLEEAAVK